MKWLLLSGGFFAMTAVILGAFAAHGLKARIEPRLLEVFQTGVQYQFYHALGLLLVALLYKQLQDQALLWSGGLMAAGIVLFSGSLYLLAITGMKWLGPITPLGGLLFICAWATLLFAALRSN